MKHNLKNFPSDNIYYIDTWAHEVKKWRKGFEKELKELIMTTEKYGFEIIEEILGE